VDDQTLDTATNDSNASTASRTDGSASTLTAEQHGWASSFCGIDTQADGQDDGISAIGNRAMDVRSSAADGTPPVVPVQPAPGQANPAQPAASAPQAVAQAKDSVAKTYRVKSVSDGDAAWTEDQVKVVSDAFGKIPDADKNVLNGVEVKRVHAIDAEHAAQFSSETKVDENTPATQTNTIEVGDSTFSSSGQPVSPGEQRRVIVHEVGHAVAEKAQRTADLADARAIEAKNTAVVAENKAVAAYNDVNDKRNALIDESNDLVGKYNTALTALNAANAAKPPNPDTVKAANDAFKGGEDGLGRQEAGGGQNHHGLEHEKDRGGPGDLRGRPGKGRTDQNEGGRGGDAHAGFDGAGGLGARQQRGDGRSGRETDSRHGGGQDERRGPEGERGLSQGGGCRGRPAQVLSRCDQGRQT
jgi:hypothetical protein